LGETAQRALFTSFSDPANQWAAARKGPTFFSYSDNCLIGTDHGVVVEVYVKLRAKREKSDPIDPME